MNFRETYKEEVSITGNFMNSSWRRKECSAGMRLESKMSNLAGGD